jgi:hypothetical protein
MQQIEDWRVTGHLASMAGRAESGWLRSDEHRSQPDHQTPQGEGSMAATSLACNADRLWRHHQGAWPSLPSAMMALSRCWAEALSSCSGRRPLAPHQHIGACWNHARRREAQEAQTVKGDAFCEINCISPCPNVEI